MEGPISTRASQPAAGDAAPEGIAADPAATLLEATGEAQHAAWRARRLPPTERIAPGLWAIPLPLPFPEPRYVTVYALELRDGVALIDAGWDTPEAWDTLTAGLAAAGGTVADVRAVLVTHIHPDHYGLSGRLREASGAWVALHPADAALVRSRYQEPEALAERMRTQLAGHGVPPDAATAMSQASLPAAWGVRHTDPDVLLEDGDRPELDGWDLRTVWTPGHSPGHVCFHAPERRLLLAGDHVLPKTSPNVSVHVQQRPDPLGDYLAALDRLAGLDVDEVLPAHEYRFRRLDLRVEQLRDHHRRRLDETERAVHAAPGGTGWELADRLRWPRPFASMYPIVQRLALGETLAHLARLQRDGRALATAEEQPIRWWPTPPDGRRDGGTAAG
jgi:glyoxylase-like metal-dependent hydrolase (beta-lactamase superfamily II)